MNTLSIPQIFAHLPFYQQHYLEILQDSTQYYTPVEQAYIHLWPFKPQPLYLGDLLQLWFSEKWHTEQPQEFGFEIFLRLPEDLATEKKFIYAIQGNLLTGENQTSLWQSDSAQTQISSVANISKYYFEFKALTRPKLTAAAISLQFDAS